MPRTPVQNAMIWGAGSVACLHPDLHPPAQLHPTSAVYFAEMQPENWCASGFEADAAALHSDWMTIGGDVRIVYEQEIAQSQAS